MTVQRENFDVAATEVVQEAESVLEGTPVVEPVPAPPAEVPDAPPVKKEDPEVKPMCCGGHPIPPLYGSGQGLFMHETTCPNYQG